MKTISLKIKPQTNNNMDSAIRKYNSENMFQVKQSEFIRLSIELLSQLILQEKPLPIKIQKEK